MKIPPERKRLYLFLGFTAILVLVILVRFASIMLAPVSKGPAAENPVLERGPILDRNGKLMAIQTKLNNVSAWRPDVKSVKDTCLLLASILDIPAVDLESRIASSRSDFLYLKKKIDQSESSKVSELLSAGRLPGIRLEPIAGRAYPNQNLASHLIGFVGDDNVGWEGIEYGFQQYLVPSRPLKARTSEESGGAAAVIDFGNQVFLTIDVNIQYYLEKIAEDVKTENDAEAVILLAADARSGEILAYVAKPDFNPNGFSSFADVERYDWPVSFSYEPGSVFKIFTIAAIMQLGGIDSRTNFVCDGAYERVLPSGETIRIKDLTKHGIVDAQKIIEYSCNAGAGYASDTVDEVNFDSILREFGFGSKTSLELPGETAGSFQPSEDWSARSKPTIAMGQEIGVSAIQMVQAATAIANGGVMMRPLVVKKILTQDGAPVLVNEPQAIRRVISPEIASQLLLYMETASSEGGTGKRAKVEDIRMSVKTGTAQITDPKTRKYSETDYIASCLAILPTDDPQLIIYIMIYKPKGPSYLGGLIAAPPIQKAAEQLVSYLGISREKSPTVAVSPTIVVPKTKPVEIGLEMPDLSGTPKRLLVPLLSRRDLVIVIHGDGRVVRQSPAPGTKVETGTEITLELE